MEERQAIERLKQGDIGGLEVLVRRYQARAVPAAYLIVRDRALAEDIVQGAFVRAYERIGQFDAERPFGPWFTRIVVNDAVKAASRRERRRERTISFEEGDDAPASWLMDPETGPQELAEEAEARRRVWKALEKLPPAQRAVVVQRYYLGMSEAEGIVLTLERVVDSPLVPQAVICFEPPDDEHRWTPMLSDVPGSNQGKKAWSEGLISTAPQNLGEGCWSLQMADTVKGRTSVTVAYLQGIPRGGDLPTGTFRPKMIRGPWTFEFEAPRP